MELLEYCEDAVEGEILVKFEVKMKVLILGVGHAQVDAIKYCKERGLEVHGCSYTNTERGIGLLDKFVQINITDKEAVLEYARREGIDVIYSVGSDIAMPTVSYVANSLNLPSFIKTSTAEICNNKQMLRDTLGQDFDGNIEYIYAESIEELASFKNYPGMLKPVDSQGQRGVYKVDSIDEAIERFPESISYSRDKKVILERYLDGPEVSVNAYMVDGTMVFGLVSDRISFDDIPGGVIKEHYLPSSLSQQIQDRVIDLAERSAKVLGIENGPCYFQVKVVEGVPYVLEVTPRLDGCHMWKLIKYYCGVDLLDLTFRHLIEQNVDENDFAVINHMPVRTVFMCQPPNSSVKKNHYPAALCECWYYDEGDMVKKMNGYMEKCGYRMEMC